MRDDERKRLENLIGGADVLALADLIVSYNKTLRDGGLSVGKAWQLTAELHGYICGSIFEQRVVSVESEYE